MSQYHCTVCGVPVAVDATCSERHVCSRVLTYPREGLAIRRPTISEDIVDAYLVRHDCVLLSAESVRQLAVQAGYEIVEGSPRNALVFRKREAA